MNQGWRGNADCTKEYGDLMTVFPAGATDGDDTCKNREILVAIRPRPQAPLACDERDPEMAGVALALFSTRQHTEPPASRIRSCTTFAWPALPQIMNVLVAGIESNRNEALHYRVDISFAYFMK